ncbi:hypothetical protein [Cupriavidus pauculus]|uniref:hypothetical protein n=1 Tax=Cupriavidus pauculus TaxID=82633 RepID=UPI001EE2D4F4|nr:hypothetical protein [Cupriavidus pauculus]GJG97752.1 hypothetical protein CBA19C6_24705 [Cupriavidus pauculus]
MKRIATAAFVVFQISAFATTTALAADGQTLTEQLLERDARLAVQKLDHELAKLGAGPATPPVSAVHSAAIPPVAVDAKPTAPRTIAVFGVDGQSAGLPVSLRSLVAWDGEVYAAKPGGEVRGYRVTEIHEATGTKLRKGKRVIVAAPAETLEGAAAVDENGRHGAGSGVSNGAGNGAGSGADGLVSTAPAAHRAPLDGVLHQERALTLRKGESRATGRLARALQLSGHSLSGAEK